MANTALHIIKSYGVGLLLSLFASTSFAKAIIDSDVAQQFNHMNNQSMPLQMAYDSKPISLLVFLHSMKEKKEFIDAINKISSIQIQDLAFMPTVAVIMLSPNINTLNQIATHPAVMQISSNSAGTDELDITAQRLNSTRSDEISSDVDDWWANGYTGQHGVLGLIDDGVDPNHPSLANKTLLVRKEAGSNYTNYLNGVRTAHGTGVACIYASEDSLYPGTAYGTSTIVTGLSGRETAETSSLMLTMSTLDWMLNRATVKPTIINYSMGNGPIACPTCPEWSGLAKVIDYVVNHEKILWVKSAGNAGYIAPTQHIPFASTLTVPGDNYNALTVANMNMFLAQSGGPTHKRTNRELHVISETSSRGPTPFGRRKPDLTAPGHDTRTCAPDPTLYGFNYTSAMDYFNGYRLMGGTSSAAPHVGASVLLIQDTGIKNPMAIKALLINSADTWTDNNMPAGQGLETGHYQIMGSEWNRTYGWGYINMQTAFKQRNNIIEDTLSSSHPVKEYEAMLDIGEKVTLVHERRVGYTLAGKEWRISHLKIEMIDLDTQRLVASDDSAIDTVHQVGNCERPAGQKSCSAQTKPIHALVRISLLSEMIDGSDIEPFALVLNTSKNKSFLSSCLPKKIFGRVGI